MRSLMGRFAALVCVGVVVSLAGCGPEDPGAGSSPGTGESSRPSASTSVLPSESAEDRETRERGEHAIEVYRSAMTELDQLLLEGSPKPSAELVELVDEPFLTLVAKLLKEVSDADERLEGEVREVAIWVDGTPTAERVRLTSCEDGSDSYYVDSEGNRLEGQGDARVQIQKVTVDLTDDQVWKVTDVETESYATFEGTECADAA